MYKLIFTYLTQIHRYSRYTEKVWSGCVLWTCAPDLKKKKEMVLSQYLLTLIT